MRNTVLPMKMLNRSDPVLTDILIVAESLSINEILKLILRVH